MTGLIERLRQPPSAFEQVHGLTIPAMDVWHKTCCEAADEIERLTLCAAHAENEGYDAAIAKIGQKDAEIERLHEAMQEMRDRYSAKCARVETLEELAKFAKAIYGRASVTEGGFVQMTSEEYLHVGQFIAATEQGESDER